MDIVDTILHGDALETLRTLPGGCVQCCVTSPPYFGLRDYGTARWVGGDPACAHRVGNQVRDHKAPDAIVAGVRPGADASRCRNCGATRIDNQLGLEATPDEYVARMVEVFREVKRVLRDDGVLWLNLGDSYAGSWGNYAPGGIKGTQRTRNGGDRWERPAYANTTFLPPNARVTGLKPKDLIGIPWLVAFALRADGWWLRSDIVWAKSNPMPESVRDRPTRSHEYIFLLAKSERYYYDAEAIREPLGAGTLERFGKNASVYAGRNDYFRKRDGGRKHIGQLGESGLTSDGRRNKRSVWTVATAPYSGAHFATFPPALIEPCILAGSRAGDIMLDPFFGAGTVGVVARRHSRHYLGIELNAAYIEMANDRIAREVQPVLWTA